MLRKLFVFGSLFFFTEVIVENFASSAPQKDLVQKATEAATKARATALKARNVPYNRRSRKETLSGWYTGITIPEYIVGTEWHPITASVRPHWFGVLTFNGLVGENGKGDRYEGEFDRGIREGYGIYFFLADGPSKGAYYEGEFRDNFFDGYGIYYHANGELSYSYYEKGVLFTETDPENTNSLDDTSDEFEQAKNKCTDIGFKPDTEKFGDCVLRLMEMNQ